MKVSKSKLHEVMGVLVTAGRTDLAKCLGDSEEFWKGTTLTPTGDKSIYYRGPKSKLKKLAEPIRRRGIIKVTDKNTLLNLKSGKMKYKDLE